jgi:hypothetical protein
MNRALEQNVIALRGIYKDNIDLIRYIMGMQTDTNAVQTTDTINALLDHNDTILNNLNHFLNAHQPTNNNLNDHYSINRRRPYNNIRHNTPNPSTNMPISRLAREHETTPLQRLIQTYFMPQTPVSGFPDNSALSSFFDPVSVFPSSIQLDRALRQVYYRDIVSPLNNSCPISLERFTDDETVTVIRHCNHIFRSDEINNWFRSSCRCPVCRYDIRGSYTSDLIDASTNDVPNTPYTTAANTNNTTINNSRNPSTTSLDNLSTQQLISLYLDSSFNTILNSTIDPSNNLLATVYIAYR